MSRRAVGTSPRQVAKAARTFSSSGRRESLTNMAMRRPSARARSVTARASAQVVAVRRSYSRE